MPVFATFEDGSVHMLDVGIGAVKRMADNRDHFADQIDVGDNANNWLMIPLVDQCVAAGLTLADNQYSIENIEPTDLSVHYSLLADIFRQTKNLPMELESAASCSNRERKIGTQHTLPYRQALQFFHGLTRQKSSITAYEGEPQNPS